MSEQEAEKGKSSEDLSKLIQDEVEESGSVNTDLYTCCGE